VAGISPNTHLSHYQILSKLGAGGILTLYLAQDTKLDRKVAIKFLNEEFNKRPPKLNLYPGSDDKYKGQRMSAHANR